MILRRMWQSHCITTSIVECDLLQYMHQIRVPEGVRCGTREGGESMRGKRERCSKQQYNRPRTSIHSDMHYSYLDMAAITDHSNCSH